MFRFVLFKLGEIFLGVWDICIIVWCWFFFVFFLSGDVFFLIDYMYYINVLKVNKKIRIMIGLDFLVIYYSLFYYIESYKDVSCDY